MFAKAVLASTLVIFLSNLMEKVNFEEKKQWNFMLYVGLITNMHVHGSVIYITANINFRAFRILIFPENNMKGGIKIGTMQKW